MIIASKAPINTRMNTNSNIIGQIIRRQRIVMCLTQKELAQTTGVSSSYIWRLESGSRFPSARILRKIAKPLGFNEVDLFTIAGYLPPRYSNLAEAEVQLSKLDPVTAWALSQETIETQRTILSIYSTLKYIANNISQQSFKNDIKEATDKRILDSAKNKKALSSIIEKKER